jgi:hypothetical protein
MRLFEIVRLHAGHMIWFSIFFPFGVSLSTEISY